MSLPVPSNPHQFWSALELHDGSVPIWPSYQDGDNERHNSHVGFMHANGIHPDQVKGYWHWDPREGRWGDLTQYTDMYQNLYGDEDAKRGDWFFGKLAYDMEQADAKWAWIEGQHPEFWHDSEHGLESAEEADEMLRGKGYDTQKIDALWNEGTVDRHLIVAHFEKLVEMALKNPKLAPVLKHLEGATYRDIDYSAVVRALDASGVKWAIGLVGRTYDGDWGVEIGAKGPTTTLPDIQQATGKQVLDVGGWGGEHEDTYGLGQTWDFGPSPGTFSSEHVGAGHLNVPPIRDWWNRIERGPGWNAPAPTPEQAAQGRMCLYHPDRPAVAAEGFAAMCADCYARYKNPTQPRPYEPAPAAQKNLRPSLFSAHEDDPYFDPEFPSSEHLDAEDDKWWDGVKPGSHAVGSLLDLQPWTPGHHGKGLVTRDGQILTWNNIGIHHQEVVQLLPRGPKDVHCLLDDIDPDGRVGMMDYDPALERPLKAVGLHPHPLTEWSF